MEFDLHFRLSLKNVKLKWLKWLKLSNGYIESPNGYIESPNDYIESPNGYIIEALMAIFGSPNGYF